mgnify:CR=1 FL=1
MKSVLGGNLSILFIFSFLRRVLFRSFGLTPIRYFDRVLKSNEIKTIRSDYVSMYMWRMD